MPAQTTGHYLEPAVMTAPGAYAGDARLRVPATVYNAVLNRPEPVLP